MHSIKSFKEWVNNNIFSIAFVSVTLNSSLSFVGEYCYVRGVLVDYLIPRIYLSQILLFLLILLFIKFSKKSFKVFLIILIFFALNIVFSANPTVSIFYLSRRVIFLPLLLLLLTSNIYKINYKFLYSINFIYLAVLLIQFFTRSSVFEYFPFGFYPFEGIGVRLDYISLFGTKQVIPLGNFPHPNVFAAFLSFLNLIYLSKYKGTKYPKINFFLIIANLISCVLLGSITSILFHLMLSLMIAFKSKSIKRLVVVLVPFFLLLITYHSSFKNVSVTSRIEQYSTSLFLLKTNSISGVGFGNYVPSIVLYENFLGRIFELQPVHNIFMLYVVEFGVVGFIALILLAFRNKKYLKITPFLVYIFTFGMFDHFLITLNQGLLILTLTIFLHKSIIDIDAK